MTTHLDRLGRDGWSLALASVLALSACKPRDAANVPDRSGAASELQAVLDEAVAAGVPGISAAVATRAGVVWTGVAGMADLQAGTPVRPDMLFGVGSITKTFAAVVILQLVEEGRHVEYLACRQWLPPGPAACGPGGGGAAVAVA